MSKIEPLRTAAKFYHPVEIGNYYITTLLEDDGWRRRTSMCREYTAPRNQKDSRQDIGPVLNMGIAAIVDVPSIEVQVPSVSDPWRSIWIIISRGKERFVNEIHRHNSGLVNDSFLLRIKEENLDKVSSEYVKLASGNRGYGSEDSDTAKSDDKPSSELGETAISATFATSSRSCGSIVHLHYTKNDIPRDKRIWDTIPGCQKCTNNSFETRISICVSQIWFDTMTNMNEKKMVRCIRTLYSQYWKKDFKISWTRNSQTRVGSIAFILEASRRVLKSVKTRMEDWSLFGRSRDIQVEWLFHQDWWITWWFFTNAKNFSITWVEHKTNTLSQKLDSSQEEKNEKKDGKQLSSLLLINSDANEAVRGSHMAARCWWTLLQWRLNVRLWEWELKILQPCFQLNEKQYTFVVENECTEKVHSWHAVHATLRSLQRSCNVQRSCGGRASCWCESFFAKKKKKPRRVHFQIHLRPDQDVVYWAHLRSAQNAGLAFWQTGSNAIIRYQSVPKECVVKAVSETGNENCSPDYSGLEKDQR